MGFFSPANSSNIYVGIWYKNIPVSTVVWVANRNNPIGPPINNCRLDMSNGTLNLIVNEAVVCVSQGAQYADEAVILDSGNLVLRSVLGIAWQSFAYPTDTWLPGGMIGFPQSSNVAAKLISRRSPDDPFSRLMVWLWRQSWLIFMVQPSDFCSTYGRCGPNAICDINSMPACGCLNGYAPQNCDTSGGCARMRPQFCDYNETVQTGYLKVGNIRLPANPETFDVARRGVCQFVCSENCSYALDSRGGCLLYMGDLMDMEKLENTTDAGGIDLYVKMEVTRLGNMTSGKKNVTVVAIALSITAAAILSCFCFCYLRRRLKNKEKRETYQNLLQLDLNSIEPPHTKRTSVGSGGEAKLKKQHEFPLFSFSSISESTNNFSSLNKLGEGGFGPVYK